MADGYKRTIELYPCGDCAVLPGYAHKMGCDVARCPLCGIQRLQCDEHYRSNTPSIWTGIWPGEVECYELGIYNKWVDKDGKLIDIFTVDVEVYQGGHWQETTADDPDGSADLNKLATMFFSGSLVWNRKLQRLVKPDYELPT